MIYRPNVNDLHRKHYTITQQMWTIEFSNIISNLKNNSNIISKREQATGCMCLFLSLDCWSACGCNFAEL